MDDKVKPGIYLLAAIIGAVAVILAAILGHEEVIEVIMHAFGTKTVTIQAAEEYTGASIYLAGDDLLTFTEADRIVAAGDTDTDQLSKGFISFWIGDLPDHAVITYAEMKIPCDIRGEPASFDTLVLQEYGFGMYTQQTFYGVPAGTWQVAWKDTVNVSNNCLTKRKITFKELNLENLIQQKLVSDWVQFVLYFQGDMIIADQAIDAIVMTSLPELKIRYYVDNSP